MSLYNNGDLISKGSEDSQRKHLKKLLSTTPLLFDAPSLGNPHDYLHKPYIARNAATLTYISAVNSIFVQIFVVGSDRCLCGMAVHGHPRSLILAPIKNV